MRRTVALLLAGAVLAAASCSPQTAAAPKGDLTLTASFDDAQDLVPGHTVQVSNVVVGSIQAVELDGYRAKVTFTIVDDQEIPVGTTATLRRTSLLGEHYIDLDFPEDFDPETGPFLEDDSVIEQTDEQPDFEELAGRAGEVIGAITADDITTLIDAGATGLGGRGATISALVDGLAEVLTVLAGQRDQIAATIDGLAALGASLAPGSDDLGVLIDDLADASGVLASQRGRLMESLQHLVRLAAVTNETILAPHTDRLGRLLTDAAPVVRTLAESRGTVERLVTDLATFSDRIHRAIGTDSLLVFAWLYVQSLFGQTDGVAVPFSERPAVDDPVAGLIELLGPT